MSRIVRDTAVGTFADSLQAAGHVRAALLRAQAAAPTARDLRREQGRQEGYGIGYEEGLQAGYEAGRNQAYADAKRELDQANAEQLAALAQSIEQMLTQFQEQKDAYFVEAEQTLAGLAVEIARRAIAKELEQSRESLIALAHEVLEEATDATKVKLRVNPMDASMLEARKADLLAVCSNIESLEIVEDRSIPFGCMLETELGLVDARVTDFLARIVIEAREAK